MRHEHHECGCGGHHDRHDRCDCGEHEHRGHCDCEERHERHDRCDCGCSGERRNWRRFVSKAEKKEFLERYLKELELEITAVKEKLGEL